MGAMFDRWSFRKSRLSGMIAQSGPEGENRIMKTSIRKRKSGFTLIELMIVVGIVAILLALAYPSYIKYVRKANRGDAQQLLLNWTVNQEIWRSNHTAYAGLGDLAAPAMDNGKYIFAFANDPDAVSFTLQATAKGDQAKDEARDGTPCTAITLNQNGVKLPAECWE
jgi:type IV pilus assembly protein PilE